MVTITRRIVIKYHGTPFGGSNQEAAEALIGRHAFISFAARQQLEVALEVCQSVAFDNGAFSAWKSGKVIDWDSYTDWVNDHYKHPRFDFAVIPDVIDGDEEANIKLISRLIERFKGDALVSGVPVWHMHESRDKLNYLSRAYYRISIGSSAEYSQVGTQKWHDRMKWAMNILCDGGQPRCKVHMLRGLDPNIFTKYPFASADSTNAARNCNIKTAWKGTYPPPSNSWRARVIMARTEAFNSADKFIDDSIPEWLQPKDLFGDYI
jgi:hypothetical protein